MSIRPLRTTRSNKRGQIRGVELALLSGIACFATTARADVCSLNPATSWIQSGAGNWFSGANWNTGTPPNSATTNVCITNGTLGVPTTVTLSASATVNSLQLGGNNSLVLSGQKLLVNGSLTNSGSLSVGAGSTLQAAGAFTNFAGDTLTGGSYVVTATPASPASLQLDALGNSGGEIVNNAANITLAGSYYSGLGPLIVDNANLDALSHFQDNLPSGTFTLNGQYFATNPMNGSSPTGFTNQGTINIGSNSGFTVGGNGDYTQIGANSLTHLMGGLYAGGGLSGNVDIDGGVLAGAGTVFGNLYIGPSATLMPIGGLAVWASVDLAGTFDDLIGATAGGSVTDEGFPTTIERGATLDVSFENGFNPAGLSLLLLNSLCCKINGEFTNVNISNLPLGDTYHLDYSNREVVLDIAGPIPEPAECLPMAGILACLIALNKGKIRSKNVFR